MMMIETVRQLLTRARARRALLAACVLCSVAFAPPVSAQEDVADTFRGVVDVVVVNVEVVVTDADGRRVTGLGRDDFRLLVGGREASIDHFAEVRDGREVMVLGGGTLSEEAGRASQAAAPSEGEAALTNLLVFVDDYFAIRNHRNVVLREMVERVADLPPGDRMAVVAFDGEEIDVLTSWTASRDEAAQALERARKRPAHGLLRAHERLRRGDEGPWTDPVVQDEELGRVVTAVRSALQMVPRPAGRRVLLLLGGGWPTRSPVPTTDEAEGSLFQGLPTTSTREGRFDDRALVADLAHSANLLGYTLYPVDIQGLRARESAVEADVVATELETGMAPAGSSPYTSELFRQGTLRFLAHETGGRPMLFDERTRVLEAVVEDTRSYYSLGFTPDLRGDGSYHRIRVQVGRPGLRVRARTGFRDVSRSEELDLLTESALRFGGSDREAADATTAPDPGGIVVSVGESRRSGRRTMEVPLRLDVPWGEVTLLPRGEAFVGHLEIRVAVRDRHGTVSEVAKIPIRIARRERPDPETILRWERDVTLRRERHDLVVTLYDAVSGQVTDRVVAVEP